MKKILALILALALVLGLATVAFAEGETAATTGSITIHNATKGYEYKAYKVFDATYDGDAVSYKTPAANAQYLDDTLFGWSAADEEGNISVWALKDAAEGDILDWVEENYSKFGGTAIDGVFDDTDSTVTFSNLAFGYYYIKSGLGATVTIDTAAPSATVYDKNDATDAIPTKKIISVDGEEADIVDETNAHVGSVIGFEIDAITTNWVYDGEDPAGWVIREEWEVTDTPTSMEIDLGSVEVYVNGTKIENTDNTVAYTAVIDEATGELTVNIPMVDANGNSIYPANLGEEAGQIPIMITYNATITQAAGETPAQNEVGETIIKVKTYEFKLSKVDENGDALKGAKFEVIYGVGDDAVALTFSMNDNGDYYVYDPKGTVTQIDLTEETIALITGLDYWDLVLKEVVVPDGYNKAADINVAKEELSEVGTEDANIVTIEVENQKGLELPSTGGIGTTIFYIVGSMMAVGAGIILVTKKRIGVEA